jgi:hypothetical protein
MKLAYPNFEIWTAETSDDRERLRDYAVCIDALPSLGQSYWQAKDSVPSWARIRVTGFVVLSSKLRLIEEARYE